MVYMKYFVLTGCLTVHIIESELNGGAMLVYVSAGELNIKALSLFDGDEEAFGKRVALTETHRDLAGDDFVEESFEEYMNRPRDEIFDSFVYWN